jgi:hypothetical protein
MASLRKSGAFLFQPVLCRGRRLALERWNGKEN